jgi:tyrosine-protein phosphatase OCA1
MSTLFPPYNFGAIEDALYRSALPNELNFTFLETLRLTTLIVLSNEHVDEVLIDFLSKHNINLVCIESSINTSSRGLFPVSEETVVGALNVLKDRANLPALLTCSSGKNISGVVVGCMRKLQKWSLVSIYEEYRRFSGYSGSKIQQQHEQFIELFDTDLVTLSAEEAPYFLIRESGFPTDIDDKYILRKI